MGTRGQLNKDFSEDMKTRPLEKNIKKKPE